ncbi:hypothetical protein LTR85_006767 [Meristemomyces frigidus]|nr:hypothetical protein LTR85_006767 [Meristemomyces frigidus]
MHSIRQRSTALMDPAGDFNHAGMATKMPTSHTAIGASHDEPDAGSGAVPDVQMRSRFCQLPAELRNRIYEAVLIQTDPIQVASVLTACTQPAFTRTCTQIREETLSMFYAYNTFIVDTVETGTTAPWKWLQSVGYHNARHIRRLGVRIYKKNHPTNEPDRYHATARVLARVCAAVHVCRDAICFWDTTSDPWTDVFISHIWIAVAQYPAVDEAQPCRHCRPANGDKGLRYIHEVSNAHLADARVLGSTFYDEVMARHADHSGRSDDHVLCRFMEYTQRLCGGRSDVPPPLPRIRPPEELLESTSATPSKTATNPSINAHPEREMTENDRMVCELSQRTKMTMRYSKECLEHARWDSEQAFETFQSVREALPTEAFMCAATYGAHLRTAPLMAGVAGPDMGMATTLARPAIELGAMLYRPAMQMAVTLAVRTRMKIQCSIDCLTQTGWDLEKGLQAYQRVKASLPQAAYPMEYPPARIAVHESAADLGLGGSTSEHMVLELSGYTHMALQYCTDCLDQAGWDFDQAVRLFASVKANLPSEAFCAPGAIREQLAEAKVKEVSRRTGMTVQYAALCLEQSGWDFGKGLQAFEGARDALPSEAFMAG